MASNVVVRQGVYLCAYGFSTLGAFAVVGLIRDSKGEVTELSRWAGLGRRYPLVGSAIALFLLACAGIPLTSGFVSKFGVFSAAAGRRCWCSSVCSAALSLSSSTSASS